MQSLHELERRAEEHRLEALKKIDALSGSSEQQELGPEALVSENGPAELASAASASHQHR
jgi:hypothetical protein